MGTLSWIIWLGPKCNHRNPYKRKAEKDLTQNGGGSQKRMSPWRPRSGRCNLKPRNAANPWVLEEAMGGFRPGTPPGSGALLTPGLQLSDTDS